MPAERRSLRSNKPESSSTNGEKARSNSQGASSNKDKLVPTRSTSGKVKSLPAKKGSTDSAAKDTSSDKPHTNGTEPVENGVNGVDDVKMDDDASKAERQSKGGKDRDGEEEMTVVVPPPKGPKLTADPSRGQMSNGAMDLDTADTEAPEEKLDPATKAVQGAYPIPYPTQSARP